MAPRLRRAPSAVVELLRLCVVVFFAGVGYYVADAVDDSGDKVLGAFTVVGLGIVLGSALGYVLGGVMGRGTLAVVRQTEVGLRSTSAEQIVAGVMGAVVGVLVAAGHPVLARDLFGGHAERDGPLRLHARIRESPPHRRIRDDGRLPVPALCLL